MRIPPLETALVPLAAILIAGAIGGLVVIVTGADPVGAGEALLHGALGTQNNVVATLLRAIPIAVSGVGIAIALRAGALNLGGEGQMVLGSVGCAVAATSFSGLPGPLAVALSLIVGSVVGALWAMLPALLEVGLQIPILITSLLFNYVASLFAAWLASYPLRDLSGGAAMAQTPMIPESEWLPNILPGTRLHAGIVVLVVLPLVVAWFFRRTVAGYEMRILGANHRFARYGGVDVNRRVVLAMLLSGATCGLAGSLLVLGLNHRHIDGFINQAGFAWSGFIAAILTAASPILTVVAGTFLAALQVGAAGMARTTTIPLQVVDVVQATIILVVAAGPGIRAAVRRVRSR
jgi:simple sugar transport system permease protein